jgi:hypothetical protein
LIASEKRFFSGIHHLIFTFFIVFCFLYNDNFLHDQTFPSKTWSNDFDGIENPSCLTKNLDGLWWELTNQRIFSQSRYNSAISFVFEFTDERFLFRQSHLTKFLMENFDRVKNYHYIKNKTQWKMWKLSDEYQKFFFFHFFRFPPSQFFLFTFPGLDFHNLKFPHIHAIIKI